MDTKTDMTVANTIRDQLGRRCLFMLGARSLIGSSSSLQFHIGQNCHHINVIDIALNGSDLYDVRFFRVRKTGLRVVTVAEAHDVYAEDLHAVIESETGMRTSL